jgi:hypothetical protein
MPAIADQLKMEGSDTAPLSVSRFLLKTGRTYEASVKAFEPYTELREPNEEARVAAAQILARAMMKKRRAYIYVNNRLEGCAPHTVDGILTLPRNF